AMTTTPTSSLPDDPILLVHAYVDGELDPANALAIEQRLAHDPTLAAEREQIEALRRLLHERLPREAPPPALRAATDTAHGLRRHESLIWRAKDSRWPAAGSTWSAAILWPPWSTDTACT